jgi:hypothetical protein
MDYKPAQRGGWEIKLAEALGTNGQDIVETLSLIDDSAIDRLCRALAEGILGDREIEGARLAAFQARLGRGFR